MHSINNKKKEELGDYNGLYKVDAFPAPYTMPPLFFRILIISLYNDKQILPMLIQLTLLVLKVVLAFNSLETAISDLTKYLIEIIWSFRTYFPMRRFA